MKKRNRTFVGVFVATLAVIGLIAVFVPSQTLRQALRSLPGAVNGADGEVQLVVKLQYNVTLTYEYKAALSRMEASQADTRPELFRQEYITRAKRALAETQGYGNGVFGHNNFKIMSEVQVVSMKLQDLSSGRCTDIWRAARRNDDGYNPVMD